MKNEEFDLNNASYVLKLHFSLNDTSRLKEYLQYTDVIRIKANDIILLYKDEI
jgi:outer membrane receptor for Fe3+-dicitrate